nr:uncharacterized protein LOC113804146 [Penaeus vannamei]
MYTVRGCATAKGQRERQRSLVIVLNTKDSLECASVIIPSSLVDIRPHVRIAAPRRCEGRTSCSRRVTSARAVATRREFDARRSAPQPNTRMYTVRGCATAKGQRERQRRRESDSQPSRSLPCVPEIDAGITPPNYTNELGGAVDRCYGSREKDEARRMDEKDNESIETITNRYLSCIKFFALEGIPQKWLESVGDGHGFSLEMVTITTARPIVGIAIYTNRAAARLPSCPTGMMTLEQEREDPKGAAGGETSHPDPRPGPQSFQPSQPSHHARLTNPRVPSSLMKPGQNPRRPRTPVRQHQVDSPSSAPEVRPSSLQGQQQQQIPFPSLAEKRPLNQSKKNFLAQIAVPGQGPARSAQEQAHRTVLCQGRKKSLGSIFTPKVTGDATGRRGSETGLGQKLKKMACEVVVPPLPPPPDPRVQARVPPQPVSLESIESVNLMDLSSDTEKDFDGVLLEHKPLSDAAPCVMNMELSAISAPCRVTCSPLASPLWAANTVSSTLTASTSSSSTAVPSRSSRRKSSTLLSPVPVGVSTKGTLSSTDAAPFTEPPAADMSLVGPLNTADTVPLLCPSASTDSTQTEEEFSTSIMPDISLIKRSSLITSHTTASGASISPSVTLPPPAISAALPSGEPLESFLPPVPSAVESPAQCPGDASAKPSIASPAPLSTPDLRIDIFEADYPSDGWLPGGADGAMEVGSPPAASAGFPAITPEDLTPAELHEFDMKYGSPHHAHSRSIKSLARPTLLALPPEKPRFVALPFNGDEDEDDDYYRLRHFSITGRRIVNRGDSFKSRRTRSNTSVASDASSFLILEIRDLCKISYYNLLIRVLMTGGNRIVTSLEGGANLVTSLVGGANLMATLEGACRTLAPGLPPAITLSCDDVSCISSKGPLPLTHGCLVKTHA